MQLVDYVEQTSHSFLPLKSALLSLSRNGVKIVRKRSKHCINYDFCNNKLSKTEISVAKLSIYYSNRN